MIYTPENRSKQKQGQ